MKAHGRAIYFVARDWVPNSDEKLRGKLKHILKELLGNCGLMFSLDKRKSTKVEKYIYKKFSELSKFIEECRKRGLSEGELSRTNQYLSKMLDSFESMKHIYQYRTPITLRAYSKIFTYSLPIVYGPYFANLGQGINPFLILVMPLLFSIILVSLDNIQEHLENPFDLVGEDDVIIRAEKFIEWLEC
jgi:hypothetical protein